MQFSDKTLRPAYNGEVTVDGKENVIMECHLTDEATDHNQLQPLLKHTDDNDIHPDNAVADAVFYSYDNAYTWRRRISQVAIATISLEKRKKRQKNSGNPNSVTMKKRTPSPARENIRSPSTTSRHERMHPISKSTSEQIALTVHSKKNTPLLNSVLF